SKRAGAIGQDDIGCERDNFGNLTAHALGIVGAQAVVDPHVLADSPAQCLQALKAARRACHSASSAGRVLSTPIRRIRSGCCSPAADGPAAPAPPSSVMNSRRRLSNIGAPSQVPPPIIPQLRTLFGAAGTAAQCRYCSLIPGFGVKLSAIILAGPTVLSA